MDFAGAWKNISDEEAEEMKKEISKLTNKSTRDLMKKLKEDRS